VNRALLSSEWSIWGVPQLTGPVRQASQATEAAPRASVSERVSAVLALVSLAAGLLLLALNMAVRIGAFTLALIGLLACVTACWYVVARRGLIRILAMLAAAIALGVTAVGLVLTVVSVWVVIAIIGLALISVFSARHALRRTPKAIRAHSAASSTAYVPAAIISTGDQAADHAAGQSGRSAGQRAQGPGVGVNSPVNTRLPAQVSGASVDAVNGAASAEPVLIMNLKSGGGKAEQFHLVDECRTRGIRPVVLRPGDDLIALAEDAVASGAPAIGMAGGDGSQAAVASVAARRHVPHVCVPAGTRNHFALDLGLDRTDVVGALDAYADQVERLVDLATVNGRTFVNNCSLGLYARVVQSPAYRDAKLRTAADVLPDLIGPDAQPLDLRFSGPNGRCFTSAHLILVSNNPYQLARPGGRGTRERLDLGLLGIVAAQVSDADDARRFMLLELTGQVQRFPGWQEWMSDEFVVHSGQPVEVGVDGEALLLEPPLQFRIQPAALRVLLPKSALRVSPAARAVRLLTRSTAADLASVAAGAAPASTGQGNRPNPGKALTFQGVRRSLSVRGRRRGFRTPSSYR
jgi:diacylglycerol kinase family enzyme